MLLLLGLSLAASTVPLASAATVTRYLNSTNVSGSLYTLQTSTGTANTGTSQKIGKTTGDYKVVPYTTSSTTTGTPAETPSGDGWETNAALNVNIASGAWTLDLTTGASSATGTAHLWATVFSCTSNAEASCTFLFKNWDNTTNILGTTTTTKRTYTTGTEPAFNGVQFLVLEWWVIYTSAGSSSTSKVTETTVSSASDLIDPGESVAPIDVNYSTSVAPSTSYSVLVTAPESYASTASLSPSYSSIVTAGGPYSTSIVPAPSYLQTVTAGETYAAAFSLAAAYSVLADVLFPTYSTAFSLSTAYSDLITVSASYALDLTSILSYGISAVWQAAYSLSSVFTSAYSVLVSVSGNVAPMWAIGPAYSVVTTSSSGTATSTTSNSTANGCGSCVGVPPPTAATNSPADPIWVNDPILINPYWLAALFAVVVAFVKHRQVRQVVAFFAFASALATYLSGEPTPALLLGAIGVYAYVQSRKRRR